MVVRGSSFAVSAVFFSSSLLEGVAKTFTPFERGADVTHGRAVEKITADF
jgi:hypothetical protein